MEQERDRPDTIGSQQQVRREQVGREDTSPPSSEQLEHRQEAPPQPQRRRNPSRVEVLDTTVQKTHEWINYVMAELHWSSQQQSYAALRAVLHALRDRLTVDEAAQLAAQLPMLIRGLYYEGWKPAITPVKARSREAFLGMVRNNFRGYPDVDPERLARAVFSLLALSVTRGEIEDVKSMLPRDLLPLWPK